MNDVDRIVEDCADPLFETALQVSQHLLDVTADAYMNHDFEAWAKRFALPSILETFDNTRTIASVEDLRGIFDGMQRHFQNFGIIGLKRKAIEAQFVSETEVVTTFVSQHVMRNLQLTDQIAAHGTLRRTDGLWQVTAHQYATNNTSITRALAGRR